MCGLGCTSSWDGAWPGQPTLTDQRDVPHRLVPRSAIKAGGRREGGGMFEVMVFVFPNNRYT